MWELRQRFSCHPWTDEQKLYMGTLAKIFLPSLDWQTKALRGNFGKEFPAILGLTNKSSTWELWQRFSCHPWTDEQKLYMGTLAKIFLPSLDWRTKALCGNFGKDFPAILGLTNKSSMWELWQRFSCHPETVEQKLYVGKGFPAIVGLTNGKDFPAILGLSNKSSMWEHWQRFSCHPWTDEQKLYVGTLAKIFLPSLDWRTKALCGNFGKDFPAILGLTNKSSMWEHWQRFSCHPWTDEQKLYVGTLAKIFLPSLDWRTKALRGNIGKDFPAILGRMAKIFLPSLDCRTKALRGNFGKDFPAILDEQKTDFGKDFPAILGLTNRKLYVGTLAKIFLPSLDWRTKALHGNFGKDFPAILGLTNKSSTWELWQRFSCHPWTDEQKLYVGTLAKIFLPSLDWRTKALRGNFGKDFPAILGLTNKSSTWELWQRFSCHPWTDEQKLYVGTLAKIFLPSLDCRTKALRGNIGKDFPAILGLTNGKDFPAILGLSNKSSMCGNFGKDFPAILGLTNKKLYVETLAKIFLPRLSNGKDFPAILGLSNKSSMWEHWQRFSCHPWTDEQKLYVGTLEKIFLPSLDWRTKALRGNFGKDFPAILGLTNKSSTWELWQRFSCHPWTDEQKLYVGTLAKIFLPSLDWRTKALRGNFGKDFPAILGLTNKSSMWELWQRFSCHPWTVEQKLYVGTLAKIFLPSLDWRTKALCGKDFPAILGLTNKSSMWEHWQRFSCHPWTDEQKLYVGTLAKIFLPSLDWRTKALRGNFGKDFPAILGLTNKSSTWELWQRFSCHPWTDERKLYMGTLAKIFLPSLDWRTKALHGNFGKDFPAILGLTNKSSTWELWQRFSCHPWTVEQKLYCGNIGKDFPAILGLTNKSSTWELGKDFPAILGLTNKSSMWELWQRFSCHPWTDEQKLYVGT